MWAATALHFAAPLLAVVQYSNSRRLEAITQRASSILATLHNFDFTDGAYPYAGVVVDETGALFGTTYGGGSNENHCATFSCGTIFKLTPMGLSYTETSFAFNGVDGLFPYASLIRVKRVLYGTTQQSTFGSGTVFKMTF